MVWTSGPGGLRACMIFLASVLFADGASACQGDAGWLEMVADAQHDGVALIRLPDGAVPLNRPFDVDVQMCLATDTPIEFFKLEATMPAHQHGMNYQPVISQSGTHSFSADGLVFHMAGVWRIAVSGLVAGSTHGYYIDLNVR